MGSGKESPGPRKKSRHFHFYNELAGEFAECLGIDPWTLQVQTQLVPHFDFGEDDHIEEMATKIDAMIAEIQKKYSAQKIEDKAATDLYTTVTVPS